jgi:hypothetical protein
MLLDFHTETQGKEEHHTALVVLDITELKELFKEGLIGIVLMDVEMMNDVNNRNKKR